MPAIESPKDVPRLHRCIAVLWPSFLTAIVATGVFFSTFDPQDLFPYGGDAGISDLGYYTIGFFCFWGLTALSGIGTLYFAMTNCLHCTPGSKFKND